MNKTERSNEVRQPKQHKPHTAPPPIDTWLQLKWGLALLGDEKGKQYLTWLAEKVKQQTQ